MIGSDLVIAHDTVSEIAMAAMNRPVAMNSGSPNSFRMGKVAASCSPRELAKKKTISGPSSSANFRSGFISLRAGLFGSSSRMWCDMRTPCSRSISELIATNARHGRPWRRFFAGQADVVVPAIAAAKSFALKGSRSSMPSPTPTK